MLKSQPRTRTVPTSTDDGAAQKARSISAEAQSRLHSTGYPALRLVSCEWRDGVLVLEGCVPNYYLKQVAQTVLRGLHDLETVDNRLIVVMPPSAAAAPSEPR